MTIKTFKLKKEICWITDCNKEASHYRKFDSNPRPTCNEHFNKLPEIAKRHYFKIIKQETNDYFQEKTISFNLELSNDGTKEVIRKLTKFLEYKTNWAYKNLRIEKRNEKEIIKMLEQIKMMICYRMSETELQNLMESINSVIKLLV